MRTKHHLTPEKNKTKKTTTKLSTLKGKQAQSIVLTPNHLEKCHLIKDQLRYLKSNFATSLKKINNTVCILKFYHLYKDLSN